MNYAESLFGGFLTHKDRLILARWWVAILALLGLIGEGLVEFFWPQLTPCRCDRCLADERGVPAALPVIGYGLPEFAYEVGQLWCEATRYPTFSVIQANPSLSDLEPEPTEEPPAPMAPDLVVFLEAGPQVLCIPSVEELGRMKKVHLIELAQEVGVSVRGTKQTIIDRILARKIKE